MLKKLSCTFKTDKTEISFLAEFSSDEQVDLSSPINELLVSGLYKVITLMSYAYNLYELIAGVWPM